MRKTTKSHLTKFQILFNVQAHIRDVNTLKNSTNDDWLTKEFFIGEQKDSSSFWFSRHSAANKSSSMALPVCTSSIKIVVELEEDKEETIVKYSFVPTGVGYFLGILLFLCLVIFLNAFYRFLLFLNGVYGMLAFFLLILGVICGVGFFNPHDRMLLLKELFKIIQSDDLS